MILDDKDIMGGGNEEILDDKDIVGDGNEEILDDKNVVGGGYEDRRRQDDSEGGEGEQAEAVKHLVKKNILNHNHGAVKYWPKTTVFCLKSSQM